MKARRSSRIACGCYVHPGHLIARVHGQWTCIEHLLATRNPTPADNDSPTHHHPREKHVSNRHKRIMRDRFASRARQGRHVRTRTHAHGRAGQRQPQPRYRHGGKPR